MGYTTQFKGELKFTKELTASQLARLSAMLGEDCREHKGWNAPGLSYIDLELTKSFDGLKHSGAEKTYDLEKLVNVVIMEMRKVDDEFGLKGFLVAQGEEIDDRWELYIGDDGMAHKRELVITGRKVTCPHCNEQFILE